MPRIVVIGGHGRTGLLIVEKLLKTGAEVVATIRNPRQMAALVKLGAEVFMLDLETSPLADIVMACRGADAVVFAAGSAEGEGSAIDRRGTLRTVRAAEKAGVERYVSISSIGASTGMSTRGFDAEMKDYYAAKRAGGKIIRASRLAWTILEPGPLTDARGTGKITLSTAALELKSIPRADVAATVVAVLAEPKSAGLALQLTSGKSPIAAAVKGQSGKAG